MIRSSPKVKLWVIWIGSNNSLRRKKVLGKLNYARGFRPPFTGGLLRPPSKTEDVKKNLTFKVLFNRVSKKLLLTKPTQNAQELYKEYADKKSIKETTIQIMNDLENTINKQVDTYFSKNEIKKKVEEENES